jgi:hypothetical protein
MRILGEHGHTKKSLEITIMKFFASTLLVCASFCAPALAQSPNDTVSSPQAANRDSRNMKDKYRLVQVDRFALKEGLDFPQEYLSNLQKEIIKLLTDAKLFEQVVAPGQPPPASPDAPLLRLTGTIDNYKQGSRAKRYLGVSGAGASEIDTQIVLLDALTGQSLVAGDLRGLLTSGVFGGSEDKATQELARVIVTHVKLMLERRVPLPGEAAGTLPSADATSPVVDRQVLILDSKDLEASEKQLEDRAGSGYRVVGYSLSGLKAADLQLEKRAVLEGNYQYRVIHPRLYNHMQREIDKAAAEGFRAVPHSVNMLGPYYVVLMEKAPGTSKAQYQYHVAQPMLVSSAQKDLEKYQSQGYTLLDEAETGAVHILLFEKPVNR